MANREIKTTLAIDGEAKFKQSLQSVDREMRTLSSELAATTSAFGKGETSMEKCRAVGENLAKQVAQQQEKLKALKGAVSDSTAAYDKAVEAYDKAVESFGEGSKEAELAAKAVDKAEKAMDGYRVQCNNAQKKLNDLTSAQAENEKAAQSLQAKHEKLEKQLKEVATACGKVAAKAAEIGGKTVISAVEAATKAFTAYVTTVTAAGTAIVKLATDAALAADDINTLAVQTGLSTDEIQKFQYASDLIDVDIDTLTGSMSKLIKNMNTATSGTGDAAEAFAALGIEITDGTGQLRNNQDVFNEAIEALSAMENETQRDAYAMAIFGKSAQDLNPLIKGGADALKELGASAENAGLILSQEALDSLNAYNDSLDIMKSNTTAAGRVIAVSLADSFKQITDVIGENIPDIAHQFVAMFSGEDEEAATEAFKETISEIANGIGEAANEMIPRFLEVFNTVFSTIIEQLPSSISAIMPVMIKGFNDLVKQIAKSLPKLAPEIADAAVTMFGGLLDGLNETIDNIVPMIPTIIDSLSATLVEGVPKIIEAGVKLLQGLIDGIAKAAPKLISKIGELIPKIVSVIVNSLPKLITAIMQVVSDVLRTLGDVLPDIVNEIATIIPAVVTAIVNGIPDLLDGAITFLSAIVDALPEVVDSLLKALPDMVKEIVAKLVSMIPQIVEGAVKLFGGILQAIPQIVASLVQAIPEIVGAIVGGLLDGVGQVFNASLQLFGGVTSNADASLEAIQRNTEAITPFVDAMNDASPQVADFTSILSEYGNTLGDIDNQIDETEQKITEVLSAALQEQRDLRDEDIADLRDYINQLRELEKEKLSIYQSQAEAELKKIQLDVGDMTQAEMAQYLANAEGVRKEANAAADNAYTSQLAIVENMHKAAGTTGTSSYYKDLADAKAEYETAIAENEAIYEAAIATLMDSATAWVSGEFSGIAGIAAQVNNKTSDWLHNMSVDNADRFGAYSNQRELYTELLAGIDVDSANAFLTMAAKLHDEKGVITNEARIAASELLSCFENLPNSFDGVATDTMRGLAKGMESYIPELANVSAMSADEIVDAIKSALDIHSPSGVTEELGEYTMEGFIVGIRNKIADAVLEAQTGAYSIAKSFETTLDTALSSIDISEKFANITSKLNIVASGSSGMVSNSTVNDNSNSVTVNNYSPKAMTRYEEMRQAQRAVQLVGMIK